MCELVATPLLISLLALRLMPWGLFFWCAMKTWYLQVCDGCQMIDDHVHEGYEVVDQCEAESWLAARNLFMGMD